MGKISVLWKKLNFQWWRWKRYCKIRYSYILYYTSSFRKENEKQLRSYKDKYKGKRIFIVCNGPSLKPKDLDRIYENGDYSFGCNRIHYIFPKTKWRPSFYTMMDIGPLSDRMQLIKSIGIERKFFRIDTYTNLRKIDTSYNLLKTIDRPYLLQHPMFSDDCAKRIFFIETTTYCMIQLAAYMGFSEIYIIGCDNNYSINKQKDGTIVKTGGHSYFEGFKDEKDDMATISRIWANNIAYETARRYADSHGIKIMNATRGGHLEAFERVDFDSLFPDNNK